MISPYSVVATLVQIQTSLMKGLSLLNLKNPPFYSDKERCQWFLQDVKEAAMQRGVMAVDNAAISIRPLPTGKKLIRVQMEVE